MVKYGVIIICVLVMADVKCDMSVDRVNVTDDLLRIRLLSLFVQPSESSSNIVNTQAPPTSTNLNVAPISHKDNLCSDNEQCIPHYLCKEDNSGTSLINLHVEIDECLCCSVPIEISPKLDEEQGTGCGYSDPIGPDVGNDDESRFGEFPWMVALLQRNSSSNKENSEYICGGAVIAPTVVLTAAHCVYGRQPELLMARAGEWDTQSDHELLPHQDAQIKEIIIHEEFKAGSLHNDIALLVLAAPYKWARNVQPICIPPKEANFINTTRCYATGWGKTKFYDEHSHIVILKKIDLPLVPHQTCEENLRTTRLGTHFKLDESFLCAGGEKDKDTCKGDGGSPLVCRDPTNPKRFYQAGIVAWGIGCGVENIPGTYANVTYFADWLQNKIHEKSLSLRLS